MPEKSNASGDYAKEILAESMIQNSDFKIKELGKCLGLRGLGGEKRSNVTECLSLN